MITPTIRFATVADLPSLETPAKEFYASSKSLGKFKIETFCSVWQNLLEMECGVIILCEVERVVIGAIGGIVHRDLYGEDLIAEEFFWFIAEEARGAGIKLYLEFEQWAKEKGAKTIQMVHLLDLMPEKVSRFYYSRGYSAIETRYSKSL